MAKEHRKVFRPRSSYFDSLEPESWVNKNEMRGFYVLFNIITMTYIICSFAKHFQLDGFLVEGTFFSEMMVDIKVISMLWPVFFAWSWLAYVLQLMVLSGLPTLLVTIFQHSTQSLMFLFSAYLVIDREWGFSQTIFVTVLALVHFMKMHSFTMVNRDLRNAWLEKKAISSGAMDYPNNLTVRNFIHYMTCPVLVYQTDYPSATKFRLWYFTAKGLLTLMHMLILYIILENSVIPVLENSKKLLLLDIVLQLILPMITLYIFFFLILFEDILNVFAEMGKFTDREFYQDWWNSTSFEEFNRKWNRPVHMFLYRHLFLECRDVLKYSEGTAKFFTFLFSALCHEMVVALVVKTIRPYLLSFMLLQIPIIILSKPISQTRAGMYLCLFGLCMGPPLLTGMYMKSL